MSAPPSSPPPAAVAERGTPNLLTGVSAVAPAPESCPLCGAPLHPEQEWCLRCGAAARTRLATASNWKAPIIVIAIVAALSFGVLVAALVKLAGNFGTTTASTATTVTTAPTAVTPTTTGATGVTGTGPQGTTTVGASTSAATGPSAVTPGASTKPGATGTATTPAPGASALLSPAAREGLRKLEREVREAKSPATIKQLRELEEHIRTGK